jgi:AGCS family alanine or glycine:cation symporter
VAYTCLKDYEAQKQQGLDPVFDPVKLGIKNADFWTHQKPAGTAEPIEQPIPGAQPESAR